MASTIYAAFDDQSHAESAIGALLDHGVSADEISLVVKHDGNFEASRHTPPTEFGYTHPTTVTGRDGIRGQHDPLENDIRQTPASIITGPTVNEAPEDVPLRAEEELNPAQNDYPRTGSVSPTEFSSVPPNAARDYNPGLENKDYNRPYENDVERDMNRDLEKDTNRAMGRGTETDMGVGSTRGHYPGAHHDPPMDGDEEDRRTDHYDPEAAAKHGLSTTTPEDAGAGAIKGTGIGLGVGAVAALAALFVPGVGLVIGGGALAAALGAVAASAGAGAIAGGVTGYLKDQGVPSDRLSHYESTYQDGGAIVGVSIPEGRVNRDEIMSILQKYGAKSVDGTAHGVTNA